MRLRLRDHSMLEHPQIEQLHYPERTGFPRWTERYWRQSWAPGAPRDPAPPASWPRWGVGGAAKGPHQPNGGSPCRLHRRRLCPLQSPHSQPLASQRARRPLPPQSNLALSRCCGRLTGQQSLRWWRQPAGSSTQCAASSPASCAKSWSWILIRRWSTALASTESKAQTVLRQAVGNRGAEQPDRTCPAWGLVRPCRTKTLLISRSRACAISIFGTFGPVGAMRSGGDRPLTCPAISCFGF